VPDLTIAWKKRNLEICGLAAREIRALDHPPLCGLPRDPGGFGLYGPTGSGKTWALAQVAATLVPSCAMLRFVGRCPESQDAAADRSLLWLNWGEQANVIRRAPLDVSDLVRDAKQARALFLDDIGAETCKQADDFAFGILKEIVDFRYRHEMPTWWSSNLGPAALAAHYGGPFASRLVAAWPDYAFNGPDRRLAAHA